MRGKVGLRRTVSAVLAFLLGAATFVVAGAGPATAATPIIHGIDVSGWQGAVDWGAVKRSGRLFAFVKATEGQGFVDKNFAANRLGMAGAGLALRGYYHFARPDRNTAAAEAAHFLRTVGPLGPGEIPVLDLEVAPSGTVGDWAAEWLALVAKGTGRLPALYSNQSYLYSVPTARLTGYPLWEAAWGNDDGTIPATGPKTDRWSRWTWWQYTSKATVPGVAGQVDDNVFVGTVEQLAAYGNGSAAPAATPDPVGDLLRGLLGGLLGVPKQ